MRSAFGTGRKLTFLLLTSVCIKFPSRLSVSPTYRSTLDLFLLYEEQQEEREDKEAESLYDVIEQAPLFWQKADTAEEQVLTT